VLNDSNFQAQARKLELSISAIMTGKEARSLQSEILNVAPPMIARFKREIMEK